MVIRIFMTFCIFLVAISTLTAQSTEPDATEPLLSYFVCDWGLLTVEHVEPNPDVFLSITFPENYSPAPASFTVTGEGAGLFEDTIIVDVTTLNGESLFSLPTTSQSDEVGGRGIWSMDVILPAFYGPTPVVVTAHSSSSEDESTIASASIQLNIQGATGLPFVEIEHPYNGEASSGAPLVIEGIAGGAFENNLVIELRDAKTNAILAETFATIESEEVGGKGTFRTAVALEVEPGTTVSVSVIIPSIEDGEQSSAADVHLAVIAPLERTYERSLVIREDDLLFATDDTCGAVEVELENKSS